MSNTPQEPFGLDDRRPPASNWVTDNEKLLAGLSYVSQIILPAVLPVILLLSPESKSSRLVRYHAAQSLGLLIAAIVYELAVGLVWAIIGAIAPPLLCLLWILPIAPYAVAIYYGYLAFRGEYAEIPWLARFMRDNHWL